jgi:hypothetical protein
MHFRSDEGARMKTPLNTRSPESPSVTPEHFLLVLLIVLAIALLWR